MKRLYITFFLWAVFSQCIMAQHCASASTAIPPHPYVAYGFAPPDAAQPCAVIGSPVSDTIYLHVWDSIENPAHIKHRLASLTIDSIDLPPGLCWETNVVSDQFTGGSYGVILISGTPTGPPGQYKLGIWVNGIVDISNTLVMVLPLATLESYFDVRYDLRVTCPGSACPAINTIDTVDSYIPYSGGVCSSLNAYITPGGTVSVCPGDSVTLTADSSAGYTYLWSTGAVNRSITVSAAASYTVTVYSGSDSAVATPTVVTAAILPDTTLTLSGPASFCMGDSLQITAAPGLSYLWSTTATTRSIEVSASGTYTVTVSNAVPCTAVSRGVSVSAEALPDTALTISGPVVFCQGDSVTITALPGLSYHWSSGSAAEGISPATTGSYAVTVTNATPCSAVSRTIAVTVNNPPTATATLTGGDSLSASPAASYQWYEADTLLPGDTMQSFTAGHTGYYYVVETSAQGCAAVSDSVDVVMINTDIRMLASAPALSLYPNPGEGLFTLEMPAAEAGSYEVHDIQGRLMARSTVSSAETPVDMASQPGGVYYLTVRTAQRDETIRFVVLR